MQSPGRVLERGGNTWKWTGITFKLLAEQPAIRSIIRGRGD